MTKRFNDGLINRCHQVDAYTAKAVQDDDLEDVLRGVAEKLEIYAFKSRPKGAGQILKKVIRKRQQGRSLLAKLSLEKAAFDAELAAGTADPKQAQEIDRANNAATKLKEYRPDNITDAWGCRFVTLFQSDIPSVVSTLLAVLHAFNEGQHGARVGLKEFVIYTNRPAQDPLSIVDPTLEALERSSFSTEISDIREPENRKSAYSSVHLVLYRGVVIDHPGKSRSRETAALEIQVRDIFEEGWGEIQHHLLYSDKDEYDLDSAGHEPEEGEDEGEAAWRYHLNALKTFVDGCSQHASIIRRQYDETKPPLSSSNVAQSVTDRSEDSSAVVQTIRLLESPEEVITATFDGYAFLDSSEQTTSPEEKTRWLVKASASFQKALDLLRPQVASAIVVEYGRTVQYHLWMELGNCQMSAGEENIRLERPNQDNEKAHFRRAFELYTLAARSNPDDAVAHYRLGKVTERLATGAAAFKEALGITERAIELVSRDRLTGLNHWMAIRLHIDRGFILWRLAQLEEKEETPDALDFIGEAAEANEDALETWYAQSEVARLKYDNRLAAHKAASNILFFVGKLVENGRRTTRLDASSLKKSMDLIDTLGIDTHADYFKTRDNFLHAYRALGDDEHARAMAEANFAELRQVAEARAGPLVERAAIEAELRGSEARCFRSACKFLFKQGMDAEQ